MARINWGRAPGILTEEDEARQLIENQQRWKGYGKTIMDLITPNQNLQPSAHDLAKRLTVEINEGVPRFRPQPGKGGAPSGLYGVPQRVRGLGTGSEAYKPAGPRGGQLTGPMAENPLVPARQTPMKEEEDEYGFLDAMFLANLVAGMQGGPPPTPYGTAVGGGNKTWASLPTLMRMS
jgi:hypothetical protein